MKQLRHLFLLASLAVLFFSCQKELSNENGDGANPGNFQWEFTEAALNFKGSIDTGYLEATPGLQSVIVEGTSTDGKGQIFVQVFGTSLTATSYKNPNVSFVYVENGSAVYQNVPTNPDEFTIVITTINATSITGTFSGKVENALGEVKDITNGKFSAALKSVTAPPLQGICKISNIGFFDLQSGLGYASITSSFNSANKVSRVRDIDSSNLQSAPDFSLTHTATRVSLDSEQYFELDANGRIKSFTGYFDLQPNSPKVIITYTFDAAGHLIKASYAASVAPTVPQYEMTLTWTNANLTRVVLNTVGTQERTQFDYEYDLSKTAKEFMCLIPTPEIFYGQSAINYGKTSTNLPVKSTLTEFNSAGTINKTSSATFSAYVIDAQNYVKSFELRGPGFFLEEDTRYVLTYKCY